jgi:hypothetical protein
MAGGCWSLQSYAHHRRPEDEPSSHARQDCTSKSTWHRSNCMLCTCMDAPTVSMLRVPVSTVHVRRCMMLDPQSYCVSVFVNDNAVTAAESSRCATARQCRHTLAVHLAFLAREKLRFALRKMLLHAPSIHHERVSSPLCARHTQVGVCKPGLGRVVSAMKTWPENVTRLKTQKCAQNSFAKVHVTS